MVKWSTQRYKKCGLYGSHTARLKREPPIAGSTPACRNICQGSSVDRARINVFWWNANSNVFWSVKPVVAGSSPAPGNYAAVVKWSNTAAL